MTQINKNPFKSRSFIDINALTEDAINLVFSLATHFKNGNREPLLQGKLIASCFFEASTRTRLSFEAAIYRLGGQIIGFADSNVTSSQKGESIADSIKIISAYADAIVLRHPINGVAQQAAHVSRVPVINAGDGSNQHPTQTLLDLFSIFETQGTLHNLSIAVVGDLKYGRTVHSLVAMAALFGMRLYFIAPESLHIPTSLQDTLKQKNVQFSFHQHINDVISTVDILYMTRFQRERFGENETHTLTDNCKLKPDMLGHAKSNLKILHPLPRGEELPTSIDTFPQAYYFQQAENGLYVRQALLALILAEPQAIEKFLNATEVLVEDSISVLS